MKDSILKIIKQTDEILWDMYQYSDKGSSGKLGAGLIFPFSREKTKKKYLRVSEQEARFAFASQILGNDLLYSIETPTEERYIFKAKEKGAATLTGMSAQTDLTIYTKKKEKILNIEFKNKLVTTKANFKTRTPIRKDLVKLFYEEIAGLWFHIIENKESNIDEIFKVFEKEIKENIKVQGKKIKGKSIIFHICILGDKLSIQKKLTFKNYRDLQYEVGEKAFFAFNYKEMKEKMKTDKYVQNGWTINIQHKKGYAPQDKLS